jgi:hypothetical protein
MAKTCGSVWRVSAKFHGHTASVSMSLSQSFDLHLADGLPQPFRCPRLGRAKEALCGRVREYCLANEPPFGSDPGSRA